MLVTRLLSLMVLILTVLAGGLIFVHVVLYQSFDTTMPPVQHATHKSDDKSFSLFSTEALSRLPLIPSLLGTKQVVAVMIENHQGARPHHSGLEDALMIQEFLVEGFISRFAVLFDAHNLPEKLGPVRSLRPYFVDGFMPWTRTVFHAGGSPEALSRVQTDPTIMSFNGLGLPDYFERDFSIAAPHNFFLSHDAAEDLLERATLFSVRWPPYRLGGSVHGTGARIIDLNFFNPQHNVTYTYDALFGTYERDNGGIISKAHPRNILILEVPIDNIEEYGRLEMTLTGKGNALLFRSGGLQQGTWSRRTLEHPFTLQLEDGADMRFAKGQIWMTALPTLDRIDWSDE